MQTRLSHIQFNVGAANIPFYKELMALLGWTPLYDSPEMFGVANKDGVSFWFGGPVKDVSNDYDGPGMNHIGIGAGTQAEVDAVAGFLKEKGIPWLFETPRHRPEFCQSPDQTYYQVMFETPDRILVEVVYTGPKA
jgi:catechol 2,3-dioxygenase-like lactoylglutathione lyase family enzyme